MPHMWLHQSSYWENLREGLGPRKRYHYINYAAIQEPGPGEKKLQPEAASLRHPSADSETHSPLPRARGGERGAEREQGEPRQAPCYREPPQFPRGGRAAPPHFLRWGKERERRPRHEESMRNAEALYSHRVSREYEEKRAPSLPEGGGWEKLHRG